MPTAPRPPRVTLGALSGFRGAFDAQYNPDSLEETLGAVYAKVKVQGMSHQPMQFEHSENWAASFDLAFDAFSSESYDINMTRNMLQSWVCPQRGSGSIASGAPTRVLFYWPGLITMSTVIMKLKFKHKRFGWPGLDMATTWFVCSVSLEEIRDTRLFADDVERSGTIRSST